MSLPAITLVINNILHGSPENGDLLYKYAPFGNKKIEVGTESTTDLVDLTMNAANAGIDINSSIIVDTEVSYDESVNVLINDRKNPIKIVNSRFYLTDSNSYNIGDRKGNLDTNIYTEENFKIEAGLIKTTRTIVSLDFLGIFNGGKLPVGSYNFYFKLADADGNESDFVSESGKVVCHIGAVNQPTSIRGGQLDENSDKIIKFRLNNLDLAYDYINIYYTRTTGDGNNEIIKTYKISDKFKINKLNTEISITGYETHEEIDSSEVNIQYTNFDSVQTNTNCQNITFAGNIQKDYEVFKTLEKYSLLITPELAFTETIGNLNHTYNESYPDNGYEYFNASNIYYKLSLWDEEIYRYGIVYILPDFTLSPVFNTRGINLLTPNTVFTPFSIESNINYQEDYIIEGSSQTYPENAKGVFKINSNNAMFSGNGEITPIGIKFNFNDAQTNVLNGVPEKGIKGLKDLTKGFFIVRQKRIPTIISQGVAIATSNKSYNPLIKGTFTDKNGASYNTYFGESFLHTHEQYHPRLGRGLFEVTDVKNNTLLCPEANLRKTLFNNYFNASEFYLKRTNYSSKGIFTDYSSYSERKIFYLGNYDPINYSNEYIPTNLLLVEPGLELTRTTNNKFCSRAGIDSIAYKHIDPVLGNLEDYSDPADEVVVPENLPPWIPKNKYILEKLNYKWTNSVSKIRGEFNTFIGTDYNNLSHGQVYNIFQKGYNFDTYWKDYFKIRYNDSSPFMAVSDRISWDSITTSTPTLYRGDCYINTFTHRMNWNFIDPELPTNHRIIDLWTWYKNYKVKFSKVIVTGSAIMEDGTCDDGLDDNGASGDITGDDSATESTFFRYKKVLPTFTYKIVDESDNESSDIRLAKVSLPGGKNFKKWSEANGTFGADHMNRPDVNAVPLGHWVTFKICSNINLAMRDLDFSRPEEETVHRIKRGFYPLQSLNQSNNLPESDVINNGISKSLSDKYYYDIPDVPFIKTSFTNRIYYSDLLQESIFKNGNRIFKAINYQDYTMEHGSITSLIEWYGKLIAVMEHGVLLIPVNERAMMTNAQGDNVYINTDTVLPKNPRVLSNTFGSVWPDSIIKTARYIYGIDTIGKKIWRTDGETFECISDMKIQKFLNDNINLKDSDRNRSIGTNFIKSHYNAFKQDVMFIFKYDNVEWCLCWNELLQKWITRYSWIPEFSENINNIFYTFANKEILTSTNCYIYKHGFAGTLEQSGIIKPTYWYGKQEPFEFEFIVIGLQGIQKIFDNLKIISNNAEPESFYYEIVGDGFNWNSEKDSIYGFTTDQNFVDLLTGDLSLKKVPYIKYQNVFDYIRSSSILKDINIKEDNKSKEKLIQLYQKANDIKKNGRLKGNMQYVEDAWDIQIQPVSFKYAYLKNGILNLSNSTEMKVRDKYIKIKVKYSGEKYSIINSIKTFFTVSYS